MNRATNIHTISEARAAIIVLTISDEPAVEYTQSQDAEIVGADVWDGSDWLSDAELVAFARWVVLNRPADEWEAFSRGWA